MSIDVDECMLEFSDYEKNRFNNFVRDHVCGQPMEEGLAPLYCTIKIEASTIGYWSSIKCARCGKSEDLSDIDTL